MAALLMSECWSALAAIVTIDVVLAGDNAIVIGLAARDVPALGRQDPNCDLGARAARRVAAATTPGGLSRALARNRR